MTFLDDVRLCVWALLTFCKVSWGQGDNSPCCLSNFSGMILRGIRVIPVRLLRICFIHDISPCVECMSVKVLAEKDSSGGNQTSGLAFASCNSFIGEWGAYARLD